MTTDLGTLSHMLRQRGADLGPPVDAASWRRFGEALPVVSGADFRAIHCGFETIDDPSYIRLWSLDEIVAHRDAGGPYVPDLPLVCVGDFLIESNYYYVDIAADAALVRWFDDEEIQVPSFRDFVAATATGRFDF